jgi:hypothetical protein
LEVAQRGRKLSGGRQRRKHWRRRCRRQWCEGGRGQRFRGWCLDNLTGAEGDLGGAKASDLRRRLDGRRSGARRPPHVGPSGWRAAATYGAAGVGGQRRSRGGAPVVVKKKKKGGARRQSEGEGEMGHCTDR